MTTIHTSTSVQHVPAQIDEIFSDMPNVSHIMDDILVIGYNENAAVHKVLQRCKEVNLKLK